RHRAKQRRCWLAHLEINGPVLDLNHHIVFELSVERMKVVICRSRAIRLHISPVEMMVIDECTVHQNSAMWLQRARNDVGGVRRRASVLRGPGAALRIRLDDE